MFRRCQLESLLVLPPCSPFQHRWDQTKPNFAVFLFPFFLFCVIPSLSFFSLLSPPSSLLIRVRPNQNHTWSLLFLTKPNQTKFFIHRWGQFELQFFVFLFTKPNCTCEAKPNCKLLFFHFMFLSSKMWMFHHFLFALYYFAWFSDFLLYFTIFISISIERQGGCKTFKDPCILPFMNFSIKIHIARSSNDHCKCYQDEVVLYSLQRVSLEAFQLCALAKTQQWNPHSSSPTIFTVKQL